VVWYRGSGTEKGREEKLEREREGERERL